MEELSAAKLDGKQSSWRNTYRNRRSRKPPSSSLARIEREARKLDVSSNHLAEPTPFLFLCSIRGEGGGGGSSRRSLSRPGEVMIGAVRCRWSSMKAVQLALNDDGICLEISLAGVAGVHVVDGGSSRCWTIFGESGL
ncbi:hypothetical protein Dimus_023331, partial [Dionaea muscipula]